MTYLVFHLVFIIPPLMALALLQRARLGAIHPRAGLYLFLLMAIAFVYTTPWDNYLVREGVWGYGEDRVIGTIGYVPIEEYIFFLLQPLLAGLWLYTLLPAAERSTSGRAHWVGAAAYAIAAATGVLLLRRPEGTYLGLILVWAAPVLALQWAYAGRRIWARRRVWALGAAAPTLYLWAADAFALSSGIWHISEAQTLGLAIGPLPIEEAIFFLVTNLLVVQGLLLFLYPPARAAAPTAPHAGAEAG